MPAFIDLTGRTFTRWTVLYRNGTNAGKQPLWLSRCECGVEKLVPSQALRTGASQSCGCLNVDVHREVCIQRNTTHGQSKSLTNLRWNAMKSRCERPGDSGFRKYGAKGIRVCDRWSASFVAFLADMGECPSQKHGIDRMDNAKGYEPGNCRWATQKEQQNNRTNNHLIGWQGEALTIAEWGERTGLKPATIERRINAYGWPVERALTEPPGVGRRRAVIECAPLP